MDPRTDHNPMYQFEEGSPESSSIELEEVFFMGMVTIPREGGELYENVRRYLESFMGEEAPTILIASRTVLDATEDNDIDYPIVFENASYYPSW